MGSNRKKFFKFDWVIINQLAVGPAPKTQHDLNTLKEKKIISILSLCREDEAPIPNNMQLEFKCERVILPDHKSGRIPTLNEINNALSVAKELINNGPLYVHCFASMERSPLLCMAWLVKEHKLSPRQSLDYLMDVHKGTSPLSEQFLLLNQL